MFGKPFRKIPMSKIINSINKNNLLTELYFTNGVNKFKIRRGIYPNIFEIYSLEMFLQFGVASGILSL